MASPPPPPAEDPTPADIWHTSKVMKGSISLQLRQQKQMFFSGSAAGIHKPKFCWLCHFGAGSNPRIHETTRWDEQPGDMLSFLHFTAKKLSDIVYEKNIQQGLLGGESRVVILNFSQSFLLANGLKQLEKSSQQKLGPERSFSCWIPYFQHSKPFPHIPLLSGLCYLVFIHTEWLSFAVA